MSIRVALNHKTEYRYDREINLGPQTIRLRPAPHCRTPVLSYSLQIEGGKHFVNWQQDPHGNYLARAVFPQRVGKFSVEVDLIADMTVINPFDFFLESTAEAWPFQYEEALQRELAPFLQRDPITPRLRDLVESIDQRPRRTIDFLVDLNQRLWKDIRYVIRMEPGVQTPEETLTSGRGSCRDSGWLLVTLLRELGLAARFASGYLIQLKADNKPIEGPAGPESDFTDLHAWAEVYLPGAGWIGLDPTSGLMAGEGHLPLACAPRPASAAPITGTLDACETEFHFSMRIQRIHEDPRVTLPYRDEVWQQIQSLGHEVDCELAQGDVRLTMGGEPTFVSIDDMEGPEWQTEALGPMKRRRANELLWRLKDRFSSGALLHHGQGKWYPGEPLPRWAFRCYWRRDGEPIWREPSLYAEDSRNYGCSTEDAQRFSRALAARLRVNPEHAQLAYEDVMYYMWRERCLPQNVNPLDSRLEDAVERQRVARIFAQGLTQPVGCILPLRYRWWHAQGGWESGWWKVRSDELFLIPGDSPMGFRLPLKSLTWVAAPRYPTHGFPMDPLDTPVGLPDYASLRWGNGSGPALFPMVERQAAGRYRVATAPTAARWIPQFAGAGSSPLPTYRGGEIPGGADFDPWEQGPPVDTQSTSAGIVPTALCVEPREGRLHVFLPPLDRLEHFLELIVAIEDTAERLQIPVVLEGYLPPHDSRLNHFSVTPDPGVIEVNVHPAHNWSELVNITTVVYEEARECRLGAEKFDRDGMHTGTGGGNHLVLGGPHPSDSPLLRRPDLLSSLIAYWHNHPSLSYLFSGRFIGPTSQAPRVDEGRPDARYELQIAMQQIPAPGEYCPPWLVDRIFRHLLVDGTGNTHRAEFCIDKLYSPDTASGRLGLLEFRGFEMPPHHRMSLTQQLLLRTLIARFWKSPYRTPLVDWGTSLHDRFMLPHFVWQDFSDVIAELQRAGYAMEPHWFEPHFEFRFPKIGDFAQQSVHVELRTAIEPWYVLGEEPGANATARYVDSSVERLQVRVSGMTHPRYVVSCNARQVPLHPTGREGEFVAGVRYRAWQPPHCLHPTIPVNEPLTFDLVDTWLERSLGGARYHVGHPGGLNPAAFPVNAFEAESRRGARFESFGHTPGPLSPPREVRTSEFPMTLDLRLG